MAAAGKDRKGRGVGRDSDGLTISIALAPLRWSNVWPAWWISARIFRAQPGRILRCFTAALLPRALWPPGLRGRIGDIRYYLAADAHRIVGVTGLYTLIGEPREAWLGWYGVDEKLRGRGLGRALLRATVAPVSGDGYATLRLWTTDDPRFTAAANRLYEACGFVREAIGVKYYGHPVLIYSRALQNGAPSSFHGKIPDALVGADLRKIQELPQQGQRCAHWVPLLEYAQKSPAAERGSSCEEHRPGGYFWPCPCQTSAHRRSSAIGARPLARYPKCCAALVPPGVQA